MLVKDELREAAYKLQSKWHAELFADTQKTQEFYKKQLKLDVEYLSCLTMITDSSSISTLDLLLTFMLNLKYSVTKIHGQYGDEEFISNELDKEFYNRVYDTFLGCDYLRVNEILSYMGHFFTKYTQEKRMKFYTSLYQIITLNLFAELKLRCNSVKEVEEVLENDTIKMKLLLWNEILCNDHKETSYINII